MRVCVCVCRLESGYIDWRAHTARDINRQANTHWHSKLDTLKFDKLDARYRFEVHHDIDKAVLF